MTAISKAKNILLGEQEPEWIVWALVIVMLVAGFLIKGSTEGKMEAFSSGGVSLEYPAGWSASTPEMEGQLLNASDPFSAAGFSTGMQVWQVPVSSIGRNLPGLEDIAFAWTNQRSSQFESFSALNTTPATVDGKAAISVEYAYVAKPNTATSLPVVVHAVDVLVLQGETLHVVSFAAEAQAFEASAGTWQNILKSVKIQ